MHINFNDIFLKMQEQLELSPAALDESLIIELVERIRPTDSYNIEESKKKFQALIQALLITPTAANTFQAYLVTLINRYKQTGLYADSGILSLDGFWNQLGQRVGAHFLPLLTDETDLKDLVHRVFLQRGVEYW